VREAGPLKEKGGRGSQFKLVAVPFIFFFWKGRRKNMYLFGGGWGGGKTWCVFKDGLVIKVSYGFILIYLFF
jgi:hypothetical protein